MAGIKGHIKVGGRAAGTKNKQPGPVKEIAKGMLFEAFTYTGKSLKRDIDQLSPAERVTFFLKAAAHFVPRLESVKLESEEDEALKVSVIVLDGSNTPKNVHRLLEEN